MQTTKIQPHKAFPIPKSPRMIVQVTFTFSSLTIFIFTSKAPFSRGGREKYTLEEFWMEGEVFEFKNFARKTNSSSQISICVGLLQEVLTADLSKNCPSCKSRSEAFTFQLLVSIRLNVK